MVFRNVLPSDAHSSAIELPESSTLTFMNPSASATDDNMKEVMEAEEEPTKAEEVSTL